MRLIGMIGLFLCLLADGQNKNDPESEKYIRLSKNRYYQKGYFIDNNNDLIEGLVKIKPKINSDAEKMIFIFPNGHKALIYLKHIKSFGFMDKRFEIENKVIYQIFEFGKPIELLKVSSDAWNTYGQAPAPGAESAKYKEKLFIRFKNDPRRIEVPRKEFEIFFNEHLNHCQMKKSITTEIQYSNILYLIKSHNSCILSKNVAQ